MDANWWNNALQSYDVGRQHRADRENAQAFQAGGYGAVEQAAGNRGDMQTAMTTRRFQDQQHEQAFQWFEQNAPYARNVLRRARAIQDPQQRGAFLQSQRQRFEGMGFQPDQIESAIGALTNPETAEQAFASYDAAFSQHEDPNWTLQTIPAQGGGYEQRAIGVGPDGMIQQGPNAIASAGGFRPITDQEREQYGIPAGVPAQVDVATGRVHTMLGRPAQGQSGGSYPDDGYDYHD